MRSSLLAVTAAMLLSVPSVQAGYAPGCTVFLPDGVASVFRDVAIQPDGRIVAAGYIDDGINRDFLIARFHPNLSLDTTFNGGFGYVQVNFDTHDEAFGVAVQTDGKIVAVGFGENNGGSKRFIAILRLLPDGSFDPTFIGGGGIMHDLVGGSAFEELHAVALQPDGKMVVAGYHTAGGVQGVFVGRFTYDDPVLPDGSWDDTFDLDGFAQPILGTSTSFASDVALADDGNIVVSATGDFTGDKDFIALRFLPDGNLDPGFGGNGGWESVDVAGNFDDASSITLDGSGRIVVAGTGNADIAIVRYLADGTPDGTFGSGGTVLHDIGTDAGEDVAMDSAGNIVVVGQGGNPDFALTRFDSITSGNLLSMSHDISAEDRALALRLRKDGKLLVAGSSQGPVSPRATLSLYNPDGSQDCGELALHPIANAGPNDFGAVSCAPNWDCVNDQPTNAAVEPAAPHDGPLTYLLSPIPAERDRYRLAPPGIPLGSVVTSIEIVALLAWSGSGAVPGAELFYQRPGFDATEVRSTTFVLSNTIYQEFRWLSSDLNWNQVELDALEIGIDHVTGDDLQMTQMYVLVTLGESLVQPVDAFTAAATGDGAGGQVTLNWLNPAFGKYDETVIRRDTAGCPATPNAGTLVGSPADGLGQTGTLIDPVPWGTYYYAAFVEDAENHASLGKCVVATAFDRTAVKVDWVYSTSDPIAALATPGLKISSNTVYTATNDGTVHAMLGGDGGLGGGSWPAGWKPFRIGTPAPNRPPVVQLPSGEWAALFGAKDGRVYAINATTGALAWRSPRLGIELASSPAAILTTFGGAHDLVFIGTRNTGQANRLYALNAADGTVAWFFDNGGPPAEIGIITSGPAVSYADNRVFFTSYNAGSGKTVWCLEVNATTYAKCGTWTDFGVSTSFGGDVDASPIRFNGLVFVSDTSPGENLDAVTPSSGVVDLIWTVGGNGARDYVFPRSGTTEVFLSTANQVLAIDTAAKAPTWAPVAITSPSVPLFVIGTDDVYVGGGDGKLHRLSAASGGPGTTECIGDCATTMVGSPAYDFTKLMIYLGTDDGNIYGVKTPF